MSGWTELKKRHKKKNGDKMRGGEIRKLFNAGISGNEDEAFDHISARSEYKPKMTHAI